MKSLVLVLGAGASREFDLPDGSQLRSAIASKLDIRFEHGIRQTSGDPWITDCLRQSLKEAGEDRPDVNSLLRVCWMIRDAMPQAISIDNFIDSHADDPRVALCGKLAIATSILEAEQSSSLWFDEYQGDGGLDFDRNAGTWSNPFFQLLTENCRRGQLAERFQQVALVVFNYDRCIEHFLLHGLRNYYNISIDESAALLSSLEVHHPYGKVGDLPKLSESGSVKFGEKVRPDRLLPLSRQIRTFTEGTDPETSNIEAIRALVRDSRRIGFLGFAFHRLNLELLFADAAPSAVERVYGTGFGISVHDCDLIEGELSSLLQVDRGLIRIDQTCRCTDLFKNYWRSLSLA